MSQILTYRLRPAGIRWEVMRDGHAGPLADFTHRDQALAWAEDEARKIGMGRLIIEGADGTIIADHEFIDEAVRAELSRR